MAEHQQPKQKKKNFNLYIVAALFFFGGLGYLVYSGISSNSVYFLNVSEAKAQTPQQLSNVRLFGIVAAENIVHPKQGMGVSFDLLDKDDATQRLRVTYVGIVPDTFKEGVEVIIEGSMPSTSQVQATSIMTKCPSKYQKIRDEEKKEKLG